MQTPLSLPNRLRLFNLTRRFIPKKVKAHGVLVPKEIIQIGNLVDGIVRYAYVQENDLVKEGQLLAEIDDSIEDSAVNATFGNLDAAQAALKYQFEFLKRQEQLYGCKQISLDAYQQAERNYQAALAAVEATKGLYETQKLIYDNKRIKCPTSGMIIAKNVSVHQSVNNYSPPSILFIIAKDIHTLKAYIYLDANALDLLKPKMPVQITIDSTPHTTFIVPIHEITTIPYIVAPDHPFARFVPKTPPPTSNCAIAIIDNTDLKLRPAMSFSAQVIVAEKEQALSVQTQTLKITLQNIQQLALDLGYHYQPLQGEARLDALHQDSKRVWILQNKTFIEKVVTTGISDGDYTEITAGLDGSEYIVSNIAVAEQHSIAAICNKYCATSAKS